MKTRTDQVRQIKENHVRYRRPKPSIVLGTVAAVVVASPLAVLIGGSAPTIAVDPSEPPAASEVTPTTINQVSLNDVPTIVLNLVKSGLSDAGVTLPPIDVSGIDLPDLPLEVPPGLIPTDLLPSVPSSTAPSTSNGGSTTTTPGTTSPGTTTPSTPTSGATTPGTTSSESGASGTTAPESEAPTDKPAGAVVKEVSQDTPFSMIGLTWDGIANTTAYVRAKKIDGGWGPWISADKADGVGEKDPNKQGTEPVWVGRTNLVQIAVTDGGVAAPGGESPESPSSSESSDPSQSSEPSASSQPSGTPSSTSTPFTTPPVPERTDRSVPTSTVTSGEVAPQAFTPKQEPMLTTTGAPGADPLQQALSTISAALISPGTGSTEGGAPSGGDPAAPTIPGIPAPTGEPQVITRAQWGADESMRCSEPTYDPALKETVVHHTAGTNDYTREQSAEIVRGIYAYHAQTLGWCDIGYNVLVDKYGQIFEGTFGGLDKNVQGTHTGGFNEETMGLSLMGDLDQVPPTPEMINSAGSYLGWRLKVAGLDPNGQGSVVSRGFDGGKYAAGETATVPMISGHRDFYSTACPGQFGYDALPQIRAIAAGAGALPTAPAPGPEVLATTDQGAIAQQWAANGGPTGALGNATTPEQTTPDGNAKYADFENGKIYWSEATGAQVLKGAIAKAWGAMGFEKSSLGLPTSAEATGPDGVTQNFQGGSLVFNLITGIVEVLRTYVDEFTNSYNGQRGTPAPEASAPAPAPESSPAAPAPEAGAPAPAVPTTAPVG